MIDLKDITQSEFSATDQLFDDGYQSVIQGINLSDPRRTGLVPRVLKLHKLEKLVCRYCTKDVDVRINLVDSDPSNILNTNLEPVCVLCMKERFQNSIVVAEGIKAVSYFEHNHVAAPPLSSCVQWEVYIKKTLDKKTNLISSALEIDLIKKTIANLDQSVLPTHATLIGVWLELSDVALIKGLTRIDVILEDKKLVLQDMMLLSFLSNQIQRNAAQAPRIHTPSLIQSPR